MKRTAALLLALVGIGGCLLLDPLDGDYQVDDSLGPCETQQSGRCDATWSHRYGEADRTVRVRVGGIATSSLDLLWVAGTFTGSLRFDQDLYEPASTELFIVRLDNDGNVDASFHGDASDIERVSAVAVDDDTLVLAGEFEREYAQCPGAPLDSGGVFVSFWDPTSFELDAVYCAPVSGPVEVTDVDVAGSTAHVVGTFSGELTASAQDVLAGRNNRIDSFVLSLDDSTGALLQPPLHAAGDDEDEDGELTISGVAALAGGAFVATGTFDGAFTVNGDPSALDTAEDGADAFLLFVDPAAAAPVLYRWGTDGDQEAGAVAVDGTTLFLAGELDDGELDFGEGALITAPPGEAIGGYVVAFSYPGGASPLGDPHWAVSLVAEDLDVTDLATTSEAVYLGGTVSGALAVAHEAFVPGACLDIFVSRFLRVGGGHSMTSRCGDADEQRFAGLATIASDDAAYFTAELAGSIALEQTHTATVESTDLLIGEMETPETP